MIIQNIDLITPLMYVVKKSKYVSIDQSKVKLVGDRLNSEMIETKLASWPFKIKKFQSKEEEIDFWFVADAMAFCFWGYPKKWTIDYQGIKLDGWWALLACHQRAMEEEVPLLSGKYLAHLTLSQLKNIYRGKPEIPLIKERWQILKGIGEILVDRYNGRFHNYLVQASHDALHLVIAIANTFPGFNDSANYKSKRVYFYKKAQLLVADLTRIHRITRVEHLIGEADYKIPALLRSMGVLNYKPQLARLVDKRQELAEGSNWEIEIRANMLWAIQLIVRELKPRFPDFTASKLDRLLWHLSQDKSMIKQPYHLTKTVNY